MYDIVLKKATIKDIELLIKLRIDYLNTESPCAENEIQEQLIAYFTKHMKDDTFICIYAEIDSVIVSTAFLSISEKPANLSFINGITGTLLNVHTYPKYRRKGYASQVVNRIIDEAKKKDVSFIELSATEDGKELYKTLGFQESRYTTMNMRLVVQ